MALKFWGKNFGERNIVCNPLSKMLQNEVQLHNAYISLSRNRVPTQATIFVAGQGGGNAKETKEGLNVLIFFDNL